MIFHYDRKLSFLRFPTMNWHCLSLVALQDIVGVARSFNIFQKIIFSLRIMLFLIIFFELVAYCLPAAETEMEIMEAKRPFKVPTPF